MIKPTNDNVLLERVPKKRASDIVVSTTQDSDIYYDFVVSAVGPKVDKFFKAGQKAMFTAERAPKHEEDGKYFIIVNQSDIVAVE